jgi:Mrp family chromosome partitioning ATPase
MSAVPLSPLESALQSVWRAIDPVWSRVEVAVRNGHRRILFVGAEHRCGTTTLAAACAIGMTRNLERRVLLAELNPFTPALAARLGLGSGRGWSAVPGGEIALRDAVRESGIAGLTVMTGGPAHVDGTGLFSSTGARTALAELVAVEQAVIIDAPPFLDHPEALVLLEHADAVVVVLRARKTAKKDALRTIQAVEQVRVPVLGVILNRFVPDLPFGIAAGAQAGTGDRRARA